MIGVEYTILIFILFQIFEFSIVTNDTSWKLFVEGDILLFTG